MVGFPTNGWVAPCGRVDNRSEGQVPPSGRGRKSLIRVREPQPELEGR